FFLQELGEKARNAYRFVRVAKFASPREEELYTVTKLDAALGYVEAKLGAPLAHPPLPIAFDRLKIPAVRDGKPVQLSLLDAHVEDVIAATQQLTKPSKKPRDHVEGAIHAALTALPGFKDLRVHVQ